MAMSVQAQTQPTKFRWNMLLTWHEVMLLTWHEVMLLTWHEVMPPEGILRSRSSYWDSVAIQKQGHPISGKCSKHALADARTSC
jgi:hypothetical protein